MRSTSPEAWYLRRVRLGAAWRHTQGKGAVAAVLDSSIDDSHPEFAGRVVQPRNVDLLNEDVRLGGWRRHGTNVAGVILAGGRAVTGLAPRAQLMPVAIPTLAFEAGRSVEADAITWAAERGADVIACAWGIQGDGDERRPLDSAVQAAIDRAVAEGRSGRGCTIVVAAGNDSATADADPYAHHPSTLTVGACNTRDVRPRYSNVGNCLWCVFPSSDPTLGDQSSIRSTSPWGPYADGFTCYDEFGFTSAAAAGIAGVVALILSANPHLYWWEVRNILRDTAVKVDRENGNYDAAGHSLQYGYGRVDAAAAVEAAIANSRSGTSARYRPKRTLARLVPSGVGP